jgi:hypothetical protein
VQCVTNVRLQLNLTDERQGISFSFGETNFTYLILKRFVTTTEISNEVLSISEGDFCMLLRKRLGINESSGNGAVQNESFTGAEMTRSDGFDRPIMVSSTEK